MKKSILYRAIPCLVAVFLILALVVPVVPTVSAAEVRSGDDSIIFANEQQIELEYFAKDEGFCFMIESYEAVLYPNIDLSGVALDDFSDLISGVTFVFNGKQFVYDGFFSSDGMIVAWGNPTFLYGPLWGDPNLDVTDEMMAVFDTNAPFLAYYDLLSNALYLCTTPEILEATFPGGSLTLSIYKDNATLTPVDYNDYVASTILDIDSGTAVVEFPADWAVSYMRYTADEQNLLLPFYGASFEFDSTILEDFGTAWFHRLQSFPLGYYFHGVGYSYKGYGLRLDNIPDGSVLEMEMSATISDITGYAPDPVFGVQVAQISADGVVLAVNDAAVSVNDTVVNGNDINYHMAASYTLSDLVDGATYLAFSFQFEGATMYDVVDVELEPMQLRVPLTELMIMVNGQNQTNALLDRVLELLEEIIANTDDIKAIAELLEEISGKLSSMGCDHSGIEALLKSIDDRLKEQGSSLGDLIGTQRDQLEFLEKLNEALEKVVDLITALPDLLIQGFKDALSQVEISLDNIFTGGQAGEDLGAAGDRLEDVGSDLDSVVGDMNDAKDELPTVAPDLDEQISDNLTDYQASDIGSLMPWNDPNYVEFWTALMLPTISSLSVALLLYFVFGKAKTG